MTDQECVRKTLNGDREAYGQLIDAYQNMVFAVALNITGSYSDSQDIVQESFLHAYRKLRTLSNPAKFPKWLCTIAKRIAIRFLKKKRRFAVSDSAIAVDQMESRYESAAESFSRKELSALLWGQVDTLPPKTREAVLLHYMEGFSIKRAAAFLGISESAMKTRLNFGRERLREIITDEIEDELRQNQPAKKNRNFILAALPAGGVPKIGLLGSLAAKGALTMAAISAKKAAIIAAAVVIGTISTVTIINRHPKPGPVVPISKESNEKEETTGLEGKLGRSSASGTESGSATVGFTVTAKKTEKDVIEGRVVDSLHRPVKNAAVAGQWYRTTPWPWPSSKPVEGKPQQAVSDFDGAFMLAGLKENLFYDLKVTAEGFAETVKQNIAAGSDGIVIVLPLESKVYGIVYDDETSEPLKGMTVMLKDLDMRSKFHEKKAVTDKKGFYVIGGLPASKTYCLMAKGDSLISDNLYIQLEEEEHNEGCDLYCYPPFSLPGIVVFKGTETPVPGVKLKIGRKELATLYSGNWGGIVLETTSDVEGKFVFTGLQEGEYTILTHGSSSYRMEPEIAANERPLLVTLMMDEVADTVVVEVLGGRVVYGRVTDKDEEALAGVRVSLMERFAYMINSRTGPDGSYSLTGLPIEGQNKFRIHFEHPDFSTVEKFAEFGEDELEAECDVVLTKGWSISGRVTNSDSEPLQGVKISSSAYSKTGFGIARWCTSDTEGRYILSNLDEGSWDITIQKKGYALINKKGVIVKGADLADINFVLGRDSTISGTLFIGLDKPLANTAVNFGLYSPKRRIYGKSDRTNEDGKFIIKGLPEGVYDINFEVQLAIGSTHPRHLRKSITNVRTGTEDLEVQFGGLGHISGVVQDAVSLKPVTEYELTAYGCETISQTYPPVMRTAQFTVTSEDGLFIIEDLPANKYKLEIQAEGYAEKSIADIVVNEDETTEDIIISLDKGCRVTGRTVYAQTSLPLSGTLVVLRNPIKFTLHPDKFTTEEDGIFAFEAIAPGKYSLWLKPEDFPAKSLRNVSVPHTGTFDLGDILFYTGGGIEGRVTDDQGDGIASAEIYALKPDGSASATTDEEGYFTISNAPPGQMELMCWVYPEGRSASAGAVYKSKIITVEEEGVVTVDFEFTSGVNVSGQIKNNEEGVPGASISLYALDFQEVEAMHSIKSNENGYFKLSNVASGKYLMSISQHDQSGERGVTPNMLYQHREIITVGNQDLSFDITSRNSLVKGRLVDTSGNPVKEKIVLFQPLDFKTQLNDTFFTRIYKIKYLQGSLNNKGEFTMGDIPPGRYTVGFSSSMEIRDFQPITEIVVKEGQNIENLELKIPEAPSE